MIETLGTLALPRQGRCASVSVLRMKLRLRHKVAGLAIASALLPVLGLTVLIAVQKQLSTDTINREIDAIISENLEHSVVDIYDLCEVANTLIQQQVNRTLAVADYVLQEQGGVSFSPESEPWSVRNQFNPDEAFTVTLPKMMVGDQPITANTDLQVRSPVVDQVKELVGGTATIFQRMNDDGDMLRVATNVETLDHARAVGTFIPATNPDGTPNPVIQAVVKEKQIYTGPAWVVNRWYLTAYQPLVDETGSVVGMIYAGVRQGAAPSLGAAMVDAEIGEHGYVWVMVGADDQLSGEFVLTGENFPFATDSREIRDAQGEAFFEDIRQEAIKSPEATDNRRIIWRDIAGEEHRLTIYFTYFQPWDWVIGVTAYGKDFEKPHQQIQKVFDKILMGTIGGALVLLTVIGLLARWLGGLIARPIAYLTDVAGLVAKGDLAHARRIMVQGCGGGASEVDLSRADDETGELYRAIQDMITNLLGLVADMKGTSTLLTESSEEISGTAKLQAGTAQDFGSSSTEIAAAVKEISTTSQELSQTMKNVTAGARQTTRVAGDGRSHLEAMREGVDDLNDATQSVSGKLSIIAEKAHNINNVVTTITKVADQTNLLSLNAAIEAEKAGEFGLGFSVVAREIRRLADQTAVATLDIEQMVKEMQSSVSAGVMEMDKFNEAVRRGVDTVSRLSGQMENIITEVEALTPRFESVEEGMQAQATGASQISEAVGSLNTAAQQTKAALDGFQNAAEKLRGLVDEVNGSIDRFRVEEKTDHDHAGGDQR